MTWFMSCLKWLKRFSMRHLGVHGTQLLTNSLTFVILLTHPDLTDTVSIFSKIVICWLIFLVITIIVLQNVADSNEMGGFYNVGPNDQLIILGCTIDTGGKYFGVIIYTR